MTEQLTKKVNRAIRLITNAVGGGKWRFHIAEGKTLM